MKYIDYDSIACYKTFFYDLVHAVEANNSTLSVVLWVIMVMIWNRVSSHSVLFNIRLPSYDSKCTGLWRKRNYIFTRIIPLKASRSDVISTREKNWYLIVSYSDDRPSKNLIIVIWILCGCYTLISSLNDISIFNYSYVYCTPWSRSDKFDWKTWSGRANLIKATTIATLWR